MRRLKRRIFDLLELSPEFSPFAKGSANDGSTKLISSTLLPIPDAGTLDIAVRLYDEDEDGPNEHSKTYEVSIGFVTEHDTATLQRYVLNIAVSLMDTRI